MKTKVYSVERRRLNGLVACALLTITVVLVIRVGCDCLPVRLGPIVDGALVVNDPDGVLGAWRLADSLDASELESIDVRSDDRTVDLTFMGGNRISRLAGLVYVVPATDRIMIGIYGGYHRGSAWKGHTLEGVFYRLTLRLDQPVAGRPIESVEPLSAPY